MLQKNILVMEFIGDHQKAAPKLKEADLSSEQITLAYEQVVQVKGLIKLQTNRCTDKLILS